MGAGVGCGFAEGEARAGDPDCWDQEKEGECEEKFGSDGDKDRLCG